MVGGYTLGMVYTATLFNRSVIDTLKLGVENDLLAARLKVAEAKSAAARRST